MKLTTYLLEGDPEELVAAIPARHHAKLVRWRRACVLTDQPVFPEDLIQERHPGDHFEALSRRWCDHNLLDDLHDEYVKNSPVPRRRAAQAVEKWESYRKAQKALEKSLEAEQARHQARLMEIARARRAAVVGEYQAAERIVQTHGRAPLVVGGVVFDPMLGPNGTTVFYRPRKTAGGSVSFNRKRLKPLAAEGRPPVAVAGDGKGKR